MTWNEARRQEGQRLKRSIWLLLSFAAIAERAAFLPAPLRFVLIFIMRRAEAAARSIINGMADDLGFEPPLDACAPPQADCSIDEVFRLARSFRVLGLMLADLAFYAGHFNVESSGHERRIRPHKKRGSLIPCRTGSHARLASDVRAHAIRAGPQPAERCLRSAT